MRAKAMLDWLIGRVPLVDPAERQRMVTEVGAPHGVAPASNRQAAHDLAAMQAYFGIDPERLPLAWIGPMRDIERVCSSCATAARCHVWQARPAGGDSPLLFCPNADRFAELAAAQHRAG